MIFTKFQNLSNFLRCWKKLPKQNKKNCAGPLPHEQIFFLLGTKGKKTSFGAPNGKKLPLGDQRKLKTSFFKLLEDFFFSWSPKGSFFPLEKEKKLLIGGSDLVRFFEDGAKLKIPSDIFPPLPESFVPSNVLYYIMLIKEFCKRGRGLSAAI